MTLATTNVVVINVTINNCLSFLSSSEASEVTLSKVTASNISARPGSLGVLMDFDRISNANLTLEDSSFTSIMLTPLRVVSLSNNVFTIRDNVFNGTLHPVQFTLLTDTINYLRNKVQTTFFLDFYVSNITAKPSITISDSYFYGKNGIYATSPITMLNTVFLNGQDGILYFPTVSNYANLTIRNSSFTSFNQTPVFVLSPSIEQPVSMNVIDSRFTGVISGVPTFSLRYTTASIINSVVQGTFRCSDSKIDFQGTAYKPGETSCEQCVFTGAASCETSNAGFIVGMTFMSIILVSLVVFSVVWIIRRAKRNRGEYQIVN